MLDLSGRVPQCAIPRPQEDLSIGLEEGRDKGLCLPPLMGGGSTRRLTDSAWAIPPARVPVLCRSQDSAGSQQGFRRHARNRSMLTSSCGWTWD